MRHKFLFFSILSFFPLCNLTVTYAQQPWAQTGAHWYYQVGDGSMFNGTGYLEIQKTGDTLFNGIVCDVLTMHYHFQQLWIGGALIDYYAPNRYTYRSNDTVYISNGSQFEVMFLANAQPGSYWVTGPDETGNCLGDTIIVDSLQSVTLSGVTMNRIVPEPFIFTPPDDPSIYYHAPIYERFGSSWYFLPMPTCLTDFVAGPLRCYSDSSGFSYTTNIVPYCDFIVGTSEVPKPEMASVYPTLAIDNVTLNIPAIETYPGCEFSIYNTNGSLILFRNDLQKVNQIDISGFLDGIYICIIKSGNTEEKHKFIKSAY